MNAESEIVRESGESICEILDRLGYSYCLNNEYMGINNLKQRVKHDVIRDHKVVFTGDSIEIRKWLANNGELNVGM